MASGAMDGLEHPLPYEAWNLSDHEQKSEVGLECRNATYVAECNREAIGGGETEHGAASFIKYGAAERFVIRRLSLCMWLLRRAVRVKQF